MKTYLSSIPMLLYRFGRRNPNKTAIIDSNLKKYTYGQLNTMVDFVGRLFPIESPKRVGILCRSGVMQIAAIFAILKNGGAYVPIDPALNGAAIRRSIASANVDFVIADEANIHRVGDVESVVLPLDVEIVEDSSLAPIDFDSRATACAMPSWNGGFDELTCIAVRKHARFLCDEFGISSSDVVLQSSVPTSQMFLAEVFATMMKGATLAILPEENRGYAKAIADFAERAGVTIICGYRPIVDDLGLLSRLPSRLRMMLGFATDKLTARLVGFNKAETWRGWFSISF